MSENMVKSNSKNGKSTIHLICNAHIDPIWQWDWQEGVSATLSTFQSAVNLLDKFDYIFCHNEVTVYKYVEEYAPALFKRIKELVKEGRWRIMGGWYLQPDCNMPSGESFVRQIKEGERYFKEKFGVFPTTAINFDPFGHTVGLVQIIKKCGQNGYLFMRPYPWELELESNQFIWRGLDGSEIKANRSRSYGTLLGEATKWIAERVSEQPQDIKCVLWGVGNHGGGPSFKDLIDIEEMRKNSEDEYIHSYPEKFIESINPDYVVDKSLHIAMPGCYSSMGRVKREHIRLENELWFTEKILSVAYGKGLIEYPEDKIHEITQDLLNAEFHDVLPGTCIKSGEENGLKLLHHGLLDAEKLKTKAFFALSGLQDPAKDGEYPILVFNAEPRDTTTNVECEFMLANQNWSDKHSVIRIYDEDGKEVKLQKIKEESNLNLDWRQRVIFEAKLKPMSLNRFGAFVSYEKKEDKVVLQNYIYNDGRKIVEIDRNTGLMKRYAVNGVEYIKEGFSLVSFDDNPDPWAMVKSQLAGFTKNERPFVLSEKPSGVFCGMQSVQVIEDGDIYLGIEAFFEQDNTRARVLYKIYKNNDFVDIDVNVFMGDINRFVKLKVPTVEKGKVMGQTAFGTEELFTDGRENVSHRFITVGDKDKRLAIINDCVYGSHYKDGALYISLVRGTTYCAHPIEERPIIPTDRFVKKMDQGENNFSFRIGAINKYDAERVAQEFNQKPYAQNIFPTKPDAEVKEKAKEFSPELLGDGVTLVTLKKADGNKGLIFRLLNDNDAEKTATLSIGKKNIELKFGKYEVKTVEFDGEFKELDKIII